MVFNPEKINKRLSGKETVVVLISPLLVFNDTVPEELREPDKTQVQFITYTLHITGCVKDTEAPVRYCDIKLHVC